MTKRSKIFFIVIGVISIILAVVLIATAKPYPADNTWRYILSMILFLVGVATLPAGSKKAGEILSD